MDRISTRTRVLIVTTLLSVLYFIMQESDFRILLNFDLGFDPVKPLILALVAYLGAFWILFFKVKGERLITVLLFPAISVFATSLFSELLIATVFSDLGQLSLVFISSIVFWFFTYVTLLTINILNTAYLQDIPLGQAARAAQFVLSLIISYLFFFLIFSNDLFIVFKLLGVGIISMLLVFISLWSIKLRIQQRLNASLAIGLLLVLATGVLSTWPVASPYLALVLSLVMYICLGIALEIRDIISGWIWIEYGSLFVLIVVMLCLVAEWGINGALI